MTIINNSMQICRQGATEAGSLGGFFTFGGKDIFGISNNHVLANFNECSVGDKIYKSGSQMMIGTLQYWIKLNDQKNYLDVALFKLAPGILPCWNIPGSTVAPGIIRSGTPGEKVYIVKNDGTKKGGEISTLFISNMITFTLSGNAFPFTGLTEITPLGGQPFSVEGESGSVIFSESHDILGILIGTIEDGSRSYYVPFIHDNMGIKAVYNLKVWKPLVNI